MGGKPSRSTPKDMRLKRNNPNAGKRTPSPKAAQKRGSGSTATSPAFDYTSPSYGSSNSTTPRKR